LREFIWASELHWVKITTNAEGGRLVANGRRNDGNYDESGPGEEDGKFDYLCEYLFTISYGSDVY